MDQGVLALVYEKAKSVLEAMIAGGDTIVMKNCRIPAKAKARMAMVILIFANPEKGFPRSLKKRNDTRFHGFGSIRAKDIRP